ncbi:MAG: hypothetical protein GWP06_03265 [Actinobacteria bacterium]|nr:hypothetical protein [Actinomycetota bacterium]
MDYLKLVKKIKLNNIALILFVLMAILPVVPTAAQRATMTDIKKSLQSEFMEGLYQRTYFSLLDRVDPDGFLQESLTGRYPGMFPRTVGGIVSLFIETGELEISEKIINCTLEAMTVNEMERIPHVFLRQTNDLIPVFNGKEPMQPETSVALCKLGQNRSVAVKFKAPDQPIIAVEAAISLNACKGVLTMALGKDKDSAPIRSVSIRAKQVNPGQLWQRFEFSQPPVLDKGREYFIRFKYNGFGYPTWFGLDDVPKQGGAFWLKKGALSSKWIYQKSHAPAYAVDVGNLRHEQRCEPYKIYDDWDQIDGQANVIMAWARLALKRCRTAFEDRTYPLVAKLMDRTSDQPYFMCGQGQAVGVNLVQNIALEHSREGRYWHTWDILTQCVVGASLESMIKVARRKSDTKHALRWQNRLQLLKNGIAQNLTRIVNGKKVYLEMRLPNSAGGVPFTGMGWLNFAPVMAQWEPLERQVLCNTVETLRGKLLLKYHGQKYLAMEYDPDGKVHDDWIIGKGVGWEIEYARQEKEYDRIIEWLDFLKSFHSGDLYSEFMHLDKTGKWTTGDGGNGEQSSWWCWALARLRKEAGLPVVGGRPAGY